MKLHLRLLTLIFILGTFSLTAQTYISKKQSYYGDDPDKEIFVTGERKIIINENNFQIDLPDEPLFKGTYTLTTNVLQDGFKQLVYKIDGGGLFAVNKDNVFVNLYATHDKGYVFYLDNYVEPTKEEKRIAKEEIDKKVALSLYKTHVKLFGEFTADCIKIKKVKPGMKEIAIVLILGQPNSINKTETMNSISKQYVYDNMYVYSDNGIVTTIQTEQ